MIQKEPVNKETAAIVPEHIEQLRDLFPQVFTEGKIDFDKLKEALGEEIDSRPERYSFTWTGKRDAIRILQTPSRATLVPAKKESINFGETNNIFIEGDNLEVHAALVPGRQAHRLCLPAVRRIAETLHDFA